VRDPIQYGIGIHAGEAIVGDIGFRGRTVFTALGDSVNVTSRLQDMTKSLNCKAIISEEVFKTAGLPAEVLTRMEVEIRGHDELMAVRTAEDPTVLASLLEPAEPSSEVENEKVIGG
jgi:adenylate cyclase